MKSKLDMLEQSLDTNSGIPLHIQVRDIIRKEVLQKKLVDENGKVETEHALMERFGVSRVTIRNALKMLVDEGVIIRERGRGTFLRINHPENWTGRLLGFTEIIKESGFVPDAQITKQGYGVQEAMESELKSKLNTERTWELKRIRFADTHPTAVEHAFYPAKYGPSLEEQDLKSIAIYKYFEEELNVYLNEAKQMISAVNADAESAALLKVKEGDALLYIERITYSSDSTPIEFLKAIYRPDHFQYLIKLSRKGL
ncbi:GntR family transcriptional regulator [Virgibacillus doumboii]|uniref:GntR family transcriptional regulator n=1 Tax=Virgibacillus doumboii TaxID=2697503 RepID=UPI0013DEC9E1|nr:GntR family transcriptional regulator [Virgibacillus doumboii]